LTNALIKTTVIYMKVTDLKDWSKLTPAEQARLKEVYNVGADDELPTNITKTMAQPAPEGATEEGGGE
jgi:hypothetical protein